jgi:Raf kinase inhibitor-like YbhB/YbcL family protein
MSLVSRRAFGLLVCLILAGFATSGQRGSAAGPVEKFEITSTAFAPGGEIPREFTCDGSNSSPALKWTAPPKGTKSLALIVDDPDAPVGTWVHWVIYDLPPEARELAAKMPLDGELADGTRQGRNDFRRLGYGGPCPPPGPAHRYFFKLYALDAKLDSKPGLTKSELEKAMQGHTLARAELMGRYKRGSQ